LDVGPWLRLSLPIEANRARAADLNMGVSSTTQAVWTTPAIHISMRQSRAAEDKWCSMRRSFLLQKLAGIDQKQAGQSRQWIQVRDAHHQGPARCSQLPRQQEERSRCSLGRFISDASAVGPREPSGSGAGTSRPAVSTTLTLVPLRGLQAR